MSNIVDKLKFVDTMVTFSEIPDEITLCFNISNCPIKCKDCHSKYLWDDAGIELDEDTLNTIIGTGYYKDIFIGFQELNK